MLSRIPLGWTDTGVRRVNARRWVAVALLAIAGVWLASHFAGLRDAPSGDVLAGRQPDVMTFTTEAERLTDSETASPGSLWNSGLASIFAPGGSVEWDLGRVVPISRAFIQADNDDTYVLAVSRDRKTWIDLWEAPPVVGAGLRNRHIETLSGSTRYVRLEPRGGDGSYSVSEVVLSSDSRGSWPPQLRERARQEPEVRGQAARTRLLIASILMAAIALLVAGHRRFAERRVLRTDPAFWTALGLTLFLVATAQAYAAKHRFNLVDDAYISLQYAKNWAAGQGLVFNPGERLEGYTNFLWVALLAPLWPLTGHDPDAMARGASWLAIAFAALGLVLILAIGRCVFPRSPLPAIFAALLVAFDDAYLSYTVVFALENQLLLVLMLGGLLLSVYRPRGWDLALGASFALVAMTRPDGLLWGVTFFMVAALQQLQQLQRPKKRAQVPSLAALRRIAASFAGLFGAYFALRYWYFGELLPNTFHLKVGTTFEGLTRGLEYLRSYGAERLGLPLLALAAVWLTRTTWVRWLLLHAALHAGYVVYVGGDFYAGHRFLMALTPSFALLCAVSLDAALKRSQGRALRRGATLVLAIAACAAVRFGTLRHGPFMTDLYGFGTVVDNNVHYMRWLKTVARPAASMVVGDIGATGLFADVRVIDTFGVVDYEVARKRVVGFGTGKAGHEKVMSREEQLARKPTYIKWGYVDDTQPPSGYYIFNDFPRHLRVEGLWVLDDLAQGRVLDEDRFRMFPADLSGWSRSGSAFASVPALGAARGQSLIVGHVGAFVNTFTAAEGDAAVGHLLSPAFVLEGDRMRLLVGGGRDPERLRVSLLVDGRRAFSETGTNWETLGRREWDISGYRGQVAHIEIVDQATGAWGHLLVDEIEQWSGTPNRTGKL